jgi:hypothetical protein
MTAAEIRRVKIPADAGLTGGDWSAMIFEALQEIAAQLADNNEREARHDAELREIMQHARAGQC